MGFFQPSGILNRRGFFGEAAAAPVVAFGFPSSINITRPATNIWNGDGSYYIGHMTGVPVGGVRNFPKNGTFTNNNNFVGFQTFGDQGQEGLGQFVAGKCYSLNLAHFSHPDIVGYNIGHDLVIGLCNLLSSGGSIILNVLQYAACSIWADPSVGDGTAGAYVVSQNPSTDFDNFPTTGWQPGGNTITAP
jgi:hypothetical protein